MFAARKRQLTGIVVSDKMTKTVVVRVERTVIHPKYRKRYIISQRYKAHDPQEEFQTGDRVTIVASRPLSADKRWTVISAKSLPQP